MLLGTDFFNKVVTKSYQIHFYNMVENEGMIYSKMYYSITGRRYVKYIQETLMANENIVYEAKFHWTYELVSWLWLIFAGWLVIGIIVFIARFIKSLTTEIVVTNYRIVLKSGWISRRTEEINLNRTEEINIKQSIIERLLGGGTVTINGTGGNSISTPTIEEPLSFRSAIASAAARSR